MNKYIVGEGKIALKVSVNSKTGFITIAVTTTNDPSSLCESLLNEEKKNVLSKFNSSDSSCTSFEFKDAEHAARFIRGFFKTDELAKSSLQVLKRQYVMYQLTLGA